MTADPQTATPKRGKTALTIAVATLMLAGVFAAGWFAGPDRLLEGYRMGNEDGYSTGYNDGRSGAAPDMHRTMTGTDYQARELLGGRAAGE